MDECVVMHFILGERKHKNNEKKRKTRMEEYLLSKLSRNGERSLKKMQEFQNQVLNRT